MPLRFIPYALEHMEERGIPRHWVEQTLAAPEAASCYRSGHFLACCAMAGAAAEAILL